MGTEQHLAEAVACPRCQAILPHGGAQCTECGAVLELPAPDNREEAEARRAALHVLRRAMRRMAGVAWVYRAGALAYAGVTLVAVLALVRPDVPLGPGVLVVALATLLTVLMLVGALQLAFRPFAWTLTLAILATAVAAVHFVGPNPLGLMSFFTAGWALAFWVALASTRGFQRLIAQHTDDYVLHHASVRTRRSLAGKSAEERHERLLDVMRRASMRASKVSTAAAAAIALASSVGTFAVLTQLRPEDLADRRAGFETTWGTGSFDAVGALFPPATREWRPDWLRGLAQGHGWGARLPGLGAGAVREEGDRTWVDYEVGGVPLSVGWLRNGLEWQLVEMELPEPPLEPVLERFLAAWRSSDLEALASFFPEGHRERWHASLARSAGFRDWEVLPEVRGTEQDRPEEGGDVIVKLQLDDGVATARWLFRRDGAWSLQTIRLPR